MKTISIFILLVLMSLVGSAQTINFSQQHELKRPRISSLNAASYSNSIGKGSIVALFAFNLPADINIQQSASLPLPTKLLDVEVKVNGTASPLFYVGIANGNLQVNYQMPFEVETGQVKVVLAYKGIPLAFQFLNVDESGVGFFTVDASGMGQGSILNSDYSPNGQSNPATKGDFVSLYLTGAGKLVNQSTSQFANPLTGEVLSTTPLYITQNLPTVKIDEVECEVLYSGLAPFLTGVYQINILIPQELTSGPHEIRVTLDEITTQTGVLIYVN